MAVYTMLSLYLCGSFAARVLNLDPRLRCVVSYMCLALYLPVYNKQQTGRVPTDSVKAVRKKHLFALLGIKPRFLSRSDHISVIIPSEPTRIRVQINTRVHCEMVTIG
jgi:hypothetical protein